MSDAAPTQARSIEADGQNVLPVLTPEVIDSIFGRLTPAEISDALRHKLVPAAWLPNTIYYATASAAGAEQAAQRGVRVVGRILPHDFRKAVRVRLGQQLISQATYRLARFFPQFSASRRLTAAQAAFACLMVCVVGAGAAMDQHALLVATSLLFSVFFLSLIALRVMCLLPQDKSFAPEAVPLSDDELPAYTVLVPLFRETSVLEQLVNALVALDYPVGKTDIKLILEEEDQGMQRALAQMTLPPQFDIIVVPAGKPQTKPRALNYALHFARGSLVTIYDAEDIPDPGQLRLAAETFAGCEPNVACLQARLTFFNVEDGWLAAHFAAEYATLFSIVLPTLAAEELPLPLGGTSNHFRRTALEQAGGWDPFNVTEDADLGMRLARSGYITGTLDSDTLEEANTHVLSWIKQRSRWLKGFLQTWLVHMRTPVTTYRELGAGGFWIFNAVTLGVFVSALLHPILLAHALYVLVSGNFVDTQSMVSTLLAGLNMAVLLPGYGVSMVLAHRALEARGFEETRFTIATLPLYWFLMMPAAWLALWDFVVKPFHWRKTQHGHAKLAKTDAATAAPSP